MFIGIALDTEFEPIAESVTKQQRKLESVIVGPIFAIESDFNLGMRALQRLAAVGDPGPVGVDQVFIRSLRGEGKEKQQGRERHSQLQGASDSTLGATARER